MAPRKQCAANYRSACRAKSKADFISKLGTVEEEADESGFWLEMLRDISQLGVVKFEPQCFPELDRLEDETDQLVAITVASPLDDIPKGWEVKLVKDIPSRRAAGTVYRDEDVNPEGAIIVADLVTAQPFASLIQPMLVEQATLRKAIRNLRRTRDLLLPRILAGHISVTMSPRAK